MEILLSILIPTYNRSLIFRTQIINLLKLINSYNLNDEIELVIGDNSSTEGEFIRCTQNTFFDNKITYTDNKINLGFDNNIFNMIDNSNGTYIWFLSDDDNISKDGINKIIDVLKSLNQNPPSLLIINNHIISNEHFQLNSFVPYGRENLPFFQTNFDSLTVFDDNELLILHLVLLSSQLSSCIVYNDRAILDKVDRNLFTGHPHSQFVYFSLKKRSIYYIISENLVTTRNRPIISLWFYNATIYGISNLYNNIITEPKYKRYRDRIRIQTISYTINLLSISYKFKKEFTSKVKYDFIEIISILKFNKDLISVIFHKLLIAWFSLLLYPLLRI